MIQLNLLPDIKKEYLQAQKTKSVVISGAIITTMVAIGIVVLLFIYVTFLQQIQINFISGNIKKKSNQLTSIQDLDKYLTIQNQLKALPQLHDQKGAHSRLFSFLPVLNPSSPDNVSLNILQLIAEEKTIILTGTTGSFQSLNVFVDTLKNAEVSYKTADSDESQKDKMFDAVLVQTSSLSRTNNQSSVAFTVKVTYRDAAFDARNRDVVASVPNITTSSSVTDSPKPPVFESEED